MTSIFFSKIHCDLDLDPITLKSEFVRGNVIPNTCVKLYRNWIINEVARVMTNGEHTYERTYVRTEQTPYPLYNYVVRGDKIDDSFIQSFHDEY